MSRRNDEFRENSSKILRSTRELAHILLALALRLGGGPVAAERCRLFSVLQTVLRSRADFGIIHGQHSPRPLAALRQRFPFSSTPPSPPPHPGLETCQVLCAWHLRPPPHQYDDAIELAMLGYRAGGISSPRLWRGNGGEPKSPKTLEASAHQA